MAKANKLTVLSRDVAVKQIDEQDYISLTDIARYRDVDATDDLIRNWLRPGIRGNLGTA